MPGAVKVAALVHRLADQEIRKSPTVIDFDRRTNNFCEEVVPSEHEDMGAPLRGCGRAIDRSGSTVHVLPKDTTMHHDSERPHNNSVSDPHASLVIRSRSAGCVFAEEEASILLERANGNSILLDRLVKAREDGAPLEPLVGWVDFAGLRLSVGPDVFVPRQRTLHLLNITLQELRRGSSTRRRTFVEAFAGVAPLAAAVSATLPGIRVIACECDSSALHHAAINLAEQGTVCASDVLNGLPSADRQGIDVIAAVPPYVPDGELGLLPREAREYEPLAALQGGVDGLRWVRAVISEAREWIAPAGLLVIELSERQLEPATQYGRALGWVPEQTEQDDDSLTSVLALRADPHTAR